MSVEHSESTERTNRILDRPDAYASISANCWTRQEMQTSKPAETADLISLDFGNQALYETCYSRNLLAHLETPISSGGSFQSLHRLRAADVIAGDTNTSDQTLTKAAVLPDSTWLLKSLQDAQQSKAVIAWDPREWGTGAIAN